MSRHVATVSGGLVYAERGRPQGAVGEEATGQANNCDSMTGRCRLLLARRPESVRAAYEHALGTIAPTARRPRAMQLVAPDQLTYQRSADSARKGSYREEGRVMLLRGRQADELDSLHV